MQPCHFIQSTISKVHAYLAVTCYLHFWQTDQDLLRATAVTWEGWNGYQNKSQHKKLTLEKKIIPPLLRGFEPVTFQSRVQRSNHWVISAPKHDCNLAILQAWLKVKGTWAVFVVWQPENNQAILQRAVWPSLRVAVNRAMWLSSSVSVNSLFPISDCFKLLTTHMRRVKFGACHFSRPVSWCIMPSQPLWLYQGKFSGPSSEFCSSVVKKRIEKRANNDNCNYDWKKDEVLRVMFVCCGVSVSAFWTGLKQNTVYSVVCLFQPCEPAWNKNKTQCILWYVCFSLVNQPEAKYSVFCGVSASALWTSLKQNTVYSVVCLFQPCEPAWNKTQCILWCVCFSLVNHPEAKQCILWTGLTQNTMYSVVCLFQPCEPSWSKTQCILWTILKQNTMYSVVRLFQPCELAWSKTQSSSEICGGVQQPGGTVSGQRCVKSVYVKMMLMKRERTAEVASCLRTRTMAKRS